MLELALFIGAQVAPLPVLTLDLQPAARTAAPAPVPTRTARFIRDGGLGDEIWVDLPLDAPLHEPAPTPSIRVSVRAGDRSVEIEARRGGQALEAVSVGFARSALGELAQYDVIRPDDREAPTSGLPRSATGADAPRASRRWP